MPTIDKTAPPKDLDADAEKLYRKLREAMRDRPPGPAQWQDTDQHLLAQTCRFEQRARKARDSFPKTGDMTSEGDRKQLTVHPLVRVMESAEKGFVDGLSRLGFTVEARSKMGIEQKPAGESKFGL
jgi:P27 family predicted phage terminase small subunit